MNVQIRGKGEPLLLIHGVISDSSFFDAVSEILKERYSVITYDRRGYGLDEKDWQGIFDVKSQAEDAAEILRNYTGEPAWILGNSAGGIVALELAMRYPDLVKGLVLLEPSIILDDESRAILVDWNQELNGYVKEKRIKKAIPAFAGIMGQSNGESASLSLSDMKQMYKNLHNFMYGELNEIQCYEPNKEKLLNLACPVVILITEDGRNSIFAVSSLKAAETLDWRIVFIPGYHNAFKDMPKSSAEALIDIIDSFG